MNKTEYQNKRKAMHDEAEALINAGDLEGANKKMEDIAALDAQFEAAATARANLQAMSGSRPDVQLQGSIAGAPAQTFTAGGGEPATGNTDVFATNEYATAFMNFVCRSTPIPEKFTDVIADRLKMMNDITTTTDASAVIPTIILQEIISKMNVYGNIFGKVRKLNVQGGMQVPILTLKPVATWIDETTPSADQRIKADEKVSFSFYGLECKIAQTLLASVVTLSMFQDQFATLAVEAMVIALEKAIVSGDGVGKPLGVSMDPRVPTENVITVSEAEISTWQSWKKKVFAKMKAAYRRGEFVMAQSTFDTYIDGLVDTTGQPIGRVNYGIDGEETYRFGGKNVEIVEDDVIVPFEAAAEGDVIAVFVNWGNYAMNSNMEMRVVRWVDNDANQVKNKCILIADGKLLDPYGVLIIKKGASAPGA